MADASPLLLAAVVVFAAAVVQSVVGMGFGVVAAPVLVLVDPRLVPGSILFLALLVASMSAIRGRADLDGKEVAVALVGRLAGAVLGGGVVAAVADTHVFSLLFAGLVLLAVALSLTPLRLQPTPAALVAAGFASGFMATITSIGAPPMGLVYQHVAAAKVRATLNGFFAVGTLVSIAALAAWGAFGLDNVLRSLILLPALAGGFWVAPAVARRVQGGRLRAIMLTVCVAASLLIIWRALGA